MRLSPDPLRVALIGVSGYGGIHLKALQRLHAEGLVHLVAATVINPAEVPEKCQALEEMGCRLYADYGEMLRSEAGKVDLCCVPTGIAWHSNMTVAGLEAGCHVLVEKPAAATVQEVDKMIRAKNAAGRMVAVGFQYMYDGTYAALKRRVVAGEIGCLREIRVKAAWPRSSAYYKRNEWAGRLNLRGRWILDSPANNALAHFLMAALHLAGPTLYKAANPLSVEAELYRAQEIESFDSISARICTDSGTDILFAVTHSSSIREDPVIDLLGETGVIRWGINDAHLAGSNGRSASRSSHPSPSDSMEIMYARILAQIRGQKQEACNLEEARKHTLVINALHEAVPIHDIPEASRISNDAENGTQHGIKGINDALSRSFATGALFSELGLPWTTGATTVEISAAREFVGPLRSDSREACATSLEVLAGKV